MSTSDHDSIDVPRLILITGIMAAGKSTVAEQVARRLPKSVHLRGDVFRRMIVGGRADMQPRPSPEAVDQLKLRYRLAAATAELYLQTGFSVVYQDIILGRGLADVLAYHRYRPLYVIVLCPAPAVVALREARRGKIGYGSFTVEDLDHELRAETPRVGLWLDTSDLTAEETVDHIVESLELGLVRS